MNILFSKTSCINVDFFGLDDYEKLEKPEYLV